MGRLLKRVPLDFDWPLNTTWEGYLNPHTGRECPTCKGTGYGRAARELSDRWYGWDRPADWVWCDATYTKRWNRAAWNNNLDEEDIAALLAADRLWDFTRVPRNEEQRQIVKQRIAEGHNSWLPFDNGYVPTPEEVNEWNRNGLGHDSINAHIVIEAKCKRMGITPSCVRCEGEGVIWPSRTEKEAYEAWKPQEPPTGEGYQLWEDTTEGSPQSPVFATLYDLAVWCEEHATVFGDVKTTAKEWYSMLDNGFVYHQQGNAIFL